MTQPVQTTVQCSNCGQPNTITLRRVIDAKQDPEGKRALLSGRLNSFQCQSCGQANQISTPILYHDPEHELLIAHVPMDVSARQQNQPEEKIIGDLMNELTDELPKEEFKAYMFNPKRALTMQGLIDQVMEADGITQDMVQEQRGRVELVQQFIEAESEDELEQLIEEHNDAIDMQFFQTLSMMAQRLMQDGNQQVVGRLVQVQETLLEKSNFGQELAVREQELNEAMESVSADLDEFNEDATRADFIDLIIEYGHDEAKLQALVSMVRPVMDDTFFQQFNERIANATGDDEEELNAIHETLQELVAQVDEQMRMVVQQKAQFLQALLSHENPEQLLRQNAQAIDDNFMSVLQANLQEAEKRQDIESAAKLREIYEMTVRILQSQMSPELKFLNQLLTTEDAAARNALIQEKAPEFGDDLLEVTDAVEQMLAQQGQPAMQQRLDDIRAELESVFS